MYQPYPSYPPPPMPPNPYAGLMQQQEDDSHLRILSICFFVKGGLQMLGGLFGLIYVLLGAAMFADTSSSDPAAATVGAVFGVVGVVIVVMCATIAILEFIAGASLSKKKRYTFCFIIAILSMMSVPLGTILGIFTLMVLNRPSVKAAFQQNAV